MQTYFWASHQLTLPDGSKEPLHSHNWLAEVEVSTEQTDRMGLAMDFNHLKNSLEKIVAHFGNGSLERIEYFQKNNSSAEMVAKYIYEKIASELPESVNAEYVKVVEEIGCKAEFRP